MSLGLQLFIVALLSIFVVSPVLYLLMGGLGLLINFICTLSIFVKYWKDL